MEPFSLKIIVVIAAGISLIMGFYMLLIHWNTVRVKGPMCWAAGNLLMGIGFLFRLIPPMQGFLPSVAPMLLTTVGLYIYLAGIWLFKEKKIKWWLVIGIPAFDIVQSFVVFFIFPLNLSYPIVNMDNPIALFKRFLLQIILMLVKRLIINGLKHKMR